MKTIIPTLFVFIALSGCMSRSELAKVEQELLYVQTANNAIKTETRLFRDLNLCMRTHLKNYARSGVWLRKIVNPERGRHSKEQIQ